ncbi:MAG TPA: 3-methyl-2-oxobutanoate hydroxymethyltransferase, partial [Actinophytocola sp.]|nr:3-methyl-2-oxobutanoate hydroxymethyltransferase [Actinophytocola sp.]
MTSADTPAAGQGSEVTAPYGTGAGTAPKPAKRVRIHHLRELKERGEPFPMLTAYDMYSAELFDEAGIPVLLVGDSAANNVFGYDTTVPVTVDELLPLVRGVTRAVKRSLVVADLP